MHLNFRKSGNLACIVKSSFFAALFAILALASMSGAAAFAQSATTGAIGGTITDSGGALLPRTTVAVENVATGLARTAKSNDSGEYLVPELEPGIYTDRKSVV